MSKRAIRESNQKKAFDLFYSGADNHAVANSLDVHVATVRRWLANPALRKKYEDLKKTHNLLEKLKKEPPIVKDKRDYTQHLIKAMSKVDTYHADPSGPPEFDGIIQMPKLIIHLNDMCLGLHEQFLDVHTRVAKHVEISLSILPQSHIADIHVVVSGDTAQVSNKNEAQKAIMTADLVNLLKCVLVECFIATNDNVTLYALDAPVSRGFVSVLPDALELLPLKVMTPRLKIVPVHGPEPLTIKTKQGEIAFWPINSRGGKAQFLTNQKKDIVNWYKTMNRDIVEVLYCSGKVGELSASPGAFVWRSGGFVAPYGNSYVVHPDGDITTIRNDLKSIRGWIPFKTISEPT